MSGGTSYGQYGSSGGSSGSTGVTSLNAETGDVNLVAGSGITVTPLGQNITIAATAPASGNLTDVGTDGIVITGGTGAVLGSGTSIAQHVADATHNGYLLNTDWVAFNAKQAAGNYLTALTGDGTASGPGSAALTLATVNSNVGSFASVTVNGKGLVTAAAALSGDATTSGAALTLATVNSNVGSFGSASSVATFTVNAKGLTTAAASTAIQIAESQVTNLVSDLAGKQATGNYITALTGDVTASGPGSAAATLATVNSNVGSFTLASITVNGKGLITAASSATTPLTVAQTTISTQAISSTAIDWSTGNVFTQSNGATSRTFTFSNQTSGQTIVVRLTQTSGTVTWPTVKWSGGVAPTATASGTDVYTFVYDGTSTYGSAVQNMS